MHPQKRSHRVSSRRGVLTFEWLLLFTIVTIGIVGGIAAIRDVTVVKYTQAANSLGALDMTYEVHKASDYYTLKHKEQLDSVAMTNTALTYGTEVKSYSGK